MGNQGLKQLTCYVFELFYINEEMEKLEPIDIDKAMQISKVKECINCLCLKEKAKVEVIN